MRKLSSMLGVLAAVCVMGASAQAATIVPTFVSAVTVGPNTTYTYTIALEGSSQILTSPPSQFVLYDVVGLVGLPLFVNNGASGVVFTPSAPATSPPPPAPFPAPSDSAAVLNVQLLQTAGSNAGPGTVQLGTLTFVSIYGAGIGSNLLYGSIDYDLTNPPTTQFNSGLVRGPVVPLPAAAWAGLSMLGGLGLFGAARRRRMA